MVLVLFNYFLYVVAGIIFMIIFMKAMSLISEWFSNLIYEITK